MPEEYEDGRYYTSQEVCDILEIKMNTLRVEINRGNMAKPRRSEALGTRGRPKNLHHEDDVRAYAQKRYGTK